MSGTPFDQQPSQGQNQDTQPSPNQSSPDFDGEEWNEAASAQARPAPLQKRRRVTRACDECRRKKIKCCGKQPCTHCTVYSYDCTYDQPSNRRRNPAPQYIEALEARLQRAESLLRTFLPQLDINDPGVDAAILSQQRQVEIKDAPLTPLTTTPSMPNIIPRPHPQPSEHDAQLRSMIESTGQLDLDERGNWDFHGGSSGIVFVRRMREQFGNLLGGTVLSRPPRAPMTTMLESPRSSAESPFDSNLPNILDLPTREMAKSLCDDCLSCACCLLRVVHLPTFYELLDRIYSTPPENFGDEENKFLPLLYMTLALGCMFASDSPNYVYNEPEQKKYQSNIGKGFKYYKAALQMMDVTDCRDLTSLQAVIFMILFLQASANLATCYSYIGIALRSALRMGLHRSLNGSFNPIERETRKRVFWIIRKLDTYVSAMLGFPMMLSPDDIDQELPLEVDDEYVTKDAVLPMPEGKLSLCVASNAHTRLISILAKVVKHIYPIKGLEQSISGNSKASYSISNAKIRDIERDLADWLDKLPMEFRPGGEGPVELLRIQQLLRLSYAHVQMTLYRPFLHYASEKSCASKTVDERSYACAAACVSVSRNIVHITSEMKKRGLLTGAYWFTMYTTFFSIISLVYYVLENPDKDGSAEILADADDGKDALSGLAQRSMAADRCSVTLKGLFEKLPTNLRNRPTSAPAKKKRTAQTITPDTKQSAPDSHRPHSSHVAQVPRATTFPMMPTPIQTSGLPMQGQSACFQVNTSSNPNLRQSYQELVTPTEVSAAATPEGSTPSNLQQNQKFGVQSQFDGNNSIPYLNAMMFPSTDPFAYPNQPLMEFDAQKQEAQDTTSSSTTQAPAMYMSNGPGIYDDLEGQLFGPLPPYLMQDEPNYSMPTTQVDSNLMSSFAPQEMVYHGLPPNNNMNGMYSNDGEDWNNMSYRQ